MQKKRRGFTIIELVAVALIIGLLAAFVVPRAFKGLGKAKHDIAIGKVAVVEQAIAQFYLNCGRFPNDSEGLAELMTVPSDVQDKWNGPYLRQSDMLDPWGNPFIYFLGSGQQGEKDYELISYGADGMEGGEGDNADIHND